MSTIAARISASRREQFVGRTDEIGLFQSALAGEQDLLLLHVFGPAGVGKTTLLRQFESLSSAGRVVWLDGKDIQPTTDCFLAAYREASIESDRDARTILFIDEYDALNPLDGWFRDSFIPTLSEDSIIVLAGRQPLSASWQSDSAWRALSRSVSLRNLSGDEQRQYLTTRGVPESMQEAAIEFTRGHPLALSLIAANLAQNADLSFDSSQPAFPDVIKILLERFIDNVPSPLHRKALEASSLVRVTTEGILAEVVDAEKAYELFEWLRSLSFTEAGAEGVSPKDLAREAISIDLRWRNPDWHAELHHRARRYYSARLERTRGAAHQAIVSDYIYLHRDNPAVKPFFDWGFAPVAYFDTYRAEDRTELIEIASRHEGPTSANILHYWLDRQPDNVAILRSSASGSPRIEGFLFKLQLQDLTEEDLDRDPGAKAASRHLADHAPLRKGEVATIFRFWMDREAHQGVSAVQSLIFVAMVQYSLTQSNLAHTFIPCHQPDFWMPMFTYASLRRLEHADFESGQKQGLYGHDWRVLTPHTWLDLLSEKEIAMSVPATEAPRLPDIVLLSRETFEEAVQEALKDFNNPAKLMSNPLLRSRVVTGQLLADSPPNARIDALRTTIREQANAWRVSGRDAKLYDALEHGYIRPAPTQERAAEQVDVSIATFRRHLKAALSRLSEGLWEIEIGG